MNKPEFEVGDAVIVTKTGRGPGRIDKIFPSKIFPSMQVGKKQARVQFGADGPFSTYFLSSLRWATRSEVRAAGMYGVGFNIRDER